MKKVYTSHSWGMTLQGQAGTLQVWAANTQDYMFLPAAMDFWCNSNNCSRDRLFFQFSVVWLMQFLH